MFWQEEEFFRFYLRLIRVFFFAALLCQSEAHQKRSIKSCSRAASASMKKDNFDEAVTDGKSFLFNLLDCTMETHKLIMKTSETEDCQTIDEMIPSEILVSVMNQKIPEAIKKRSLAAEDQRLILLSTVYLVHISHRIRYFSCLVNFWNKPDIILKEHHSKSVERLHFELNHYVFAFLDSTLMAQWKSGNTTILQNNSDTLINMLNNFSTTLISLLEEISSYIDQSYSKDNWWFVSARESVARLDEIKKGMLASKTELANIKTLIKPRDGFLSGMFPSISDICTKWNIFFLFFGLICLGLRGRPPTDPPQLQHNHFAEQQIPRNYTS